MDKKTFANYMKWLLSQCTNIRDQLNKCEQYRIAGIQKDKNNAYYINLQVVGKNIVFKATPEEILADDNLMHGFSKSDIRMLTFLACQNLHKPKAKIVAQEFSEETNKLLLALSMQNENDIIKKTAFEISLDKELISSLSAKDAHMVGYLTAEESHYS